MRVGGCPETRGITSVSNILRIIERAPVHVMSRNLYSRHNTHSAKWRAPHFPEPRYINDDARHRCKNRTRSRGPRQEPVANSMRFATHNVAQFG